MPAEKLYKVLVNGQSCHGGSATWFLPEALAPDSKLFLPGKWMPDIVGKLEVCTRGYHLTREPAQWWLDGATLYEAEYDGEIVDDGVSDKVAVRRVRLLREVPWSEGQVFTEGTHSITRGFSRASGSASVEASGSASVEAYDSASVRASGSASVRASGSASVEAYDSASVEASGSASVEAYDSASVRASGSASVVSTVYHSPSAQVALADLAAHIDRRNGKLVLRKARAKRTAKAAA